MARIQQAQGDLDRALELLQEAERLYVIDYFRRYARSRRRCPTFVEAFVGIPSGVTGVANLGVLPGVYSVTGILHLLGGVLVGIATLRAGILPRWAAGLLIVGTVAPIALALLPHKFIRLAAVPGGVALVALGAALWSERRVNASSPFPSQATLPLRETGVA